MLYRCNNLTTRGIHNPKEKLGFTFIIGTKTIFVCGAKAYKPDKQAITVGYLIGFLAVVYQRHAEHNA